MEKNVAMNPHTSIGYWLNETESHLHKISYCHQVARDTKKSPRAHPWPHANLSVSCAGAQFSTSLKMFSLRTEGLGGGGGEERGEGKRRPGCKISK